MQKTSTFNEILATIDENSEFLHISKSDNHKERLLLAVSEAVCRRLILQVSAVDKFDLYYNYTHSAKVLEEKGTINL